MELENNHQNQAQEPVEEKLEFHINEPFNGVFAFLRKKYGGNPHTKGIVQISASTTAANHPFQVVDYDWTSHWVSEDSPGQWIKFDFKGNRLLLTDYTIKTYNYVTGGCHLRSWVVEGSSNDNDWITIDKRQSFNDLNDKYKVKSYQCKNPGAFRFIRMLMTGKCHADSDVMVITNIEFFGTLRLE